MSIFGRKSDGYLGPFQKSKNQRKAPRRTLGTNAWIRLDGGFAVRPCRVIDISDTGVQIVITEGDSLRGEFTLLMSRTSGTGRRARIKWRHGSKIGAEFI